MTIHSSRYTKEVSDVVTSEGQKSRIGHVIILKNITSFKELDLAKTNFIATISHELKTPISSIKMSIKLLDDGRIGSVNEAQRELVQSINEDSDRLLKITKEFIAEQGGTIWVDSTLGEGSTFTFTLPQVKKG